MCAVAASGVVLFRGARAPAATHRGDKRLFAHAFLDAVHSFSSGLIMLARGNHKFKMLSPLNRA